MKKGRWGELEKREKNNRFRGAPTQNSWEKVAACAKERKRGDRQGSRDDGGGKRLCGARSTGETK